MKTTLRKITIVLGLTLFGTLLTAQANAACGNLKLPKLNLQSWEGLSTPPSLRLVHDADDDIVGMWHVIFTAQGNGSEGPPDRTVIDNAVVVWHGDGTEIMNSGRPAQDGNFCMGVWENQGRLGYKLNHFALGNDTANAPTGIGNPAGPTHIQQTVFLSRNGNSYAGTFVLDAYDTAGNPGPHIIGIVTATRITVNTPVSSFF